MLFINLSNHRINTTHIVRYTTRDNYYDRNDGSRVFLMDGHDVLVKESVEEIDAILHESYITVKTIRNGPITK